MPARDRASALAVVLAVTLSAALAAVFLSGWTPGPTPDAVETTGVPVAGPAEPATRTVAAQPQGLSAAELFQVFCGQCHTLAAARTSGDFGPDLDRLRPTRARVLLAIERGGLGTGEMPAHLVDKARAARIAAYVAQTAG